MAVYKFRNSWRADIFANGRKVASRGGFDRKDEAKRWHDETLTMYRRDPDSVTPPSKSTFEDLVTLFENNHLPTIRASTRDRYKLDIRYRIAPFFQFMELRRIDGNLIERFKSSLMRQNLRPKSINNCLMTLHLILKKAVRWKMLKESPYESELLAVPRNHQLGWWDQKEWIWRFLDEAKRRSRYYPAYLLALETGMRLGEITGLAKQDVDLESGRIRVHRQWSESYQSYGPCKHDLERWIDFDPNGNLGIALRSAIQHSKDPECIFVTSNGKRVRNRKLAQAHFHHLEEKAGAPRITFHGLRHTFASWYMKDIGDIWALKQILGHTDIKTTLRYAHHSARHRKKPLGISERSLTFHSQNMEVNDQPI